MSALRSILITDCGSTTTKALLIERGDAGWRLTARGDAPTTVEAPFSDVTLGVRNAIAETEELRGRSLLHPDGSLRTPQIGDAGVDLYLTTSSAGGGLQMLVAGAVRSMSAQSAERAALCAGAVVMETIALNDSRTAEERIERIRCARPDMILLTGGTDGGSVRHVAQLAEIIAAARPRPRVGDNARLPVVYAGNRDARDLVRRQLASQADLCEVDNLRPTLDDENLAPARDRIHELFMEHVMAQAPGYDRLRRMTPVPVLPTPAAVGRMIEALAAAQRRNVLAVDIGGATTDVFTVVDGRFNRTVSANLGMSYSISTVLAAAGLDNVLRWMPGHADARVLRDRIRNKMIRPTTLPETVEDLQLEHAIAREALRLSFEQHRQFAGELRGRRRERGIGDAFAQSGPASALDPMQIDLMIGSGGILSHAPRRSQAMLMMIDGFEPRGVTAMAVDRIFMLPHLGVLAGVDPDAAMQVLHRDCLVLLGTVIAPVGRTHPGRLRCRVELVGEPSAVSHQPHQCEALASTNSLRTQDSGLSTGLPASIDLLADEFVRLPLPSGASVTVRITPARGIDVGAGPGRPLEAKIEGGEAGIVLDGRGRPLRWPTDVEARRAAAARWIAALDAYPDL